MSPTPPENESILEITTQQNERIVFLRGADQQILASYPLQVDVQSLNRAPTPQAYASLLTKTVFPQPLPGIDPQSGIQRLRLKLTEEAELELNGLRWECLLNPAGSGAAPLAAHPNSPFSRLPFADRIDTNHPPQTGWPLRLLIALSNPIDLDSFDLTPIDTELERAELERALSPLRGLVEATFLDPPISLDRICRALEARPQIFHFLGHGSTNQRTKEAFLFLENETDRRVQTILQAEWLQRLQLLPAAPHLVFLGACESAVQVVADSLIGIAPAFLQAGVGAVVAMRDKIGVEVAREFISQFYYHLATHGTIDIAVNQARSYLLDWGGWGWSTPILFQRRGAERIFSSPPEPLEAEAAHPGEVLILIPEFKGSEEAFFEIDLRDALQERVAKLSLKNVRVVWLQHTTLGPGDEKDASRLAARYGASVVIWGWYDRSRFRANFTSVAPVGSPDISNPLHSEASVRSLLFSEQDFAVFVNHELPRQVDYFVFFTISQLYYWAGEFPPAWDSLNQALQAIAGETGEKTPGSLAYAYFYRGNLQAVYRQDRPAAIADYRQALALAPTFAIAANNLGDALRIWGNTLQSNGKEGEAIQAYQDAITAYSKALEIDPGYGLAYEGRARAGYEIGAYPQAVDDYQAALARRPRAETYHQLGLALRNLERDAEALSSLDQAIARAPAVGSFYFSRGRLRNGLKDKPGAIADFQTYLRLSPQDDPERRMKVIHWLETNGNQT